MKKLAIVTKIAHIISNILLIILLVLFIKDYREKALEEMNEGTDAETAQA